jgi:hypothetical protein
MSALRAYPLTRIPTAAGLVAFADVDLARSAATAGSVSTGAQPKANVDITSFLISFSNLIHWPAFWRERNILSMLQVYGESCRAAPIGAYSAAV